jgi:hypothetical protein
MANRRSRPRRGGGGSNVLVSGDTGPRGPQGGAAPGASESGDLAAREYGVPQADVPGGKRHWVNPQARPAATVPEPERPADYHKYHGVPSDGGQYETPGSEVGKAPRPAPEPQFTEPVPVFIQQEPGRKQRIRALITEGPVSLPVFTGAGVDPMRIADRDPHRVKLWICNEDSNVAHFIRIGAWETVTDGRGLQIPGGQKLQDFNTQDAVYVIQASSGSGVVISWGYETEVEASGL